jgi:hypothetical protein
VSLRVSFGDLLDNGPKKRLPKGHAASAGDEDIVNKVVIRVEKY